MWYQRHSCPVVNLKQTVAIIWLACLLVSPVTRAMLQEEETEELNMTARFVQLKRDSATNTFTMTSALPTGVPLDRQTITLLSVMCQGVTAQGDRDITLNPLQEDGTLRGDTQAVDSREQDLTITHPWFHAALTYVYRYQTHKAGQVLSMKKEVIDYSKDMERTIYIINELFVDTIEFWLSQQTKETFSPVFPQAGKSMQDYPEDLQAILSSDRVTANLHHEDKTSLPSHLKHHLRLQSFIRRLFMSLSINLDSMVNDREALLRLLDLQFSVMESVNAMSSVYPESEWVFLKSLATFKHATGHILYQLIAMLDNKVHGERTLAFYQHLPVCSVICAQAIHGQSQDELVKYFPDGVRLDMSEDEAEYEGNIDAMSKICDAYPLLKTAVVALLTKALSEGSEDDILPMDRSAIQLIYSLRYSGAALAAFHGIPFEPDEAEACAVLVLNHLNTVASTGDEQAQAAGQAALILCEWPQLFPVVRDLLAMERPSDACNSDLVATWLQHFHTIPYDRVEPAICAQALLLQGLITPQQTPDFQVPIWHDWLASYLAENMPVVAQFKLPLLAAVEHFSARQGEEFSCVLDKLSLISALKQCSRKKYKPLQISVWNPATGAL